MALEMDFSRLDAKDALDIAAVIEEEAQLAYDHLAEWMTSDGNTEAAEFFKRMSVWEKRHRDEIAARRAELFGDAPSTYDEEAAWEAEVSSYEELGRDVTLEQAFDVAMGAETRAYDFYNGVLDYVSEPQVVELFEWLKKAEVEHQRMLTEERKKYGGG